MPMGRLDAVTNGCDVMKSCVTKCQYFRVLAVVKEGIYERTVMLISEDERQESCLSTIHAKEPSGSCPMSIDSNQTL